MIALLGRGRQDVPFFPKLRKRRVHVDRIPQHDDVESQAQGSKLILLPFAIALPQLAALSMENLTGHAVTAFPAIQLPERRAAAALVVDVCENMQRLLDPTEFRQACANRFGRSPI